MKLQYIRNLFNQHTTCIIDNRNSNYWQYIYLCDVKSEEYNDFTISIIYASTEDDNKTGRTCIELNF